MLPIVKSHFFQLLPLVFNIFYPFHIFNTHSKVKLQLKKRKIIMKKNIFAHQHRPAPNSASDSSPGPSSGFHVAEKKNRKGVF
jgi:hypothetical protein